MAIVAEEKFRLQQELNKIWPGMGICDVFVNYRLTPESESVLLSRIDKDVCLPCIDRTVAAELGVFEEKMNHFVFEGGDDGIKYCTMNPAVHPDSLTVCIPMGGEPKRVLLKIQLELAEYIFDFGEGNEVGSYRVADIKIKEKVSKGGSCIVKEYVKKEIRGQAQFWDPRKVHVVKNMLAAKFGVVDSDAGDNFIHQPRDYGENNPSALFQN